ncbi:MAG TPA: MmgE/PrpD family protein [Methanobacterium sp.]|nr:MmgE/PrpD family protein [Methanobacterium sp.]
MLTSKFADYILSTSYENLPEGVIVKAKECFMDYLGVALRGSGTRSGKAVQSVISAGKDSTVLGEYFDSINLKTKSTPYKASVRDAGLVNGVFAHCLDLDDGHRLAQLHPGACVIPAAMALCEAYNKSGKELLEAIVVGYHVTIVLGMMVNPEHRNQGFHSTGTCGTLGAAAAASKVLDLNRSQIVDALGLAGTQAAGLLESDHSGSMGKHLHAGKAAHSGILAVQLAKVGFTGADAILEGNEGFLNVMAGINPGNMNFHTKIDEHPEKSNIFELPETKNIDELMENHKILEVYFKIYPVCRHLHSSIDAFLELVKEHNIRPNEVERITVDTYEIAADHDNYHPDSTEALRQSLPFSLTMTLLNAYNEQDILETFQYPPLNKEIKDKIENLSQKIVIKKDAQLNLQYPYKRPSRISILTNKGLYEKQVDLPYGEPENPLINGDIHRKFLNLNPKLDMEVINIIESIDSYTDINNFTADLNSFLNHH